MDTVGRRMKKIDSLQVVRALAFLEIYSSHILWGSGALGVSIFFILSGFLITYNHVNEFGGGGTQIASLGLRNNYRYAINKLKELYPLHVIMTCYVIAADGIRQAGSISTLIRNAIAQLMLIQTWIPEREIYFALNGVSWYLSTALFTYFCFPYIISYIRKYQKKSNAIIAILIVTGIQLAIGMILHTLNASGGLIYYLTYVFPLYRIGDFLIGCNLGYLFYKRKPQQNKNNRRYSVLELVVIIALFICELGYITNIIPTWLKYQMWFLPVSMAFVWIFAISRGKVSQLLTNRVTFFIASISSYGFLIHHKVIATVKYVMNILNIPVNDWIIAIIAMVITIAASMAYKYLFRAIVARNKIVKLIVRG